MRGYDADISQVQRNVQYYDLKRCKVLAVWLAERIHAMEIDKEQYKTSIQELQLSSRARNVLLHNNITTIGQLLKTALNFDEIRVLKGAGKQVQREIEATVIALRKNN